MNDIRALLKIAARRLELNSFIGTLHAAAIVFAAIALALMLADRATASSFVPWVWVGPALIALSFFTAAVIWSRRRATESHVALVVDERLDLREKLSTALCVQGRDDAFAQAAIEDAVNVSRAAGTHEKVRRYFGVTAPREWWISPLLVLVALVISFVHPLNLFARELQPDPSIDQARLDADKSIEAVVKAIKEKPELSKELQEVLGELSPEGSDPNAPKTPEDVKRDALKKVSNAQNKLEDLLQGEKGKTKEAIDKALNQLKTPEDGAAKELAEALAKGDFAAAQKALQELMEKAQNGQMNEEDKQKAAEQLQKIAEQLQQLAQQQQQLQNALKQAGMDPNLANNPQALQQAIQNNQNLNQQQQQQLQQMAQAQQAACQMCQGLGNACQQMAQGMQQGQMGQMGQAGQQMGQQLGQMEQLQQLLQQAQAAANACKGQCQGLGQGLNMQQAMNQWCMKQGMGMGNRGRAAGGKAQYAPTPTGTKIEKAKTETTDGDVIARELFETKEQVRGESKAKLVEIIEQARKGFDEGLTEEQTHVKYEEAMKHYFGELEKMTKTIQAEEPASNQPAPEDSSTEEPAGEQPAPGA